jgi:hypothetical protein
VALGLAHDPVRNRVLLFGGSATNSAGPVFGDTWEWDGLTWGQLLPANAPSARYGHVMVGDPLRRRVVLLGGGDVGAPTSETWLWDGTDWHDATAIVGTTFAEVRAGTIAYEDRQGLVVRAIPGGGSPSRVLPVSLDDDWRSDPYPTPTSLFYRYNSCLAYDSSRNEVVLFGGYDGVGTIFFGDTWTYRPANKSHHQPLGTGCATTLGLPTLTTSYAGTAPSGVTWRLSVTNAPGYTLFILGFRGDSWSGNPLPVDLTPFGMPGCQAYLEPQQLAATAASQGVARISMRLPPDPWLYGIDIYAQAIVGSPGTNALGAAVSNAVLTRIGAW